tara:strand:- start:12287 stop:13702 length:1416 start_codon:yes stop_codon:yes gene_type:complete
MKHIFEFSHSTLRSKICIFSIFIPAYFTLTGCATYIEQPLPERHIPVNLATLVDQANHSPAFMPHFISLEDGLSLDDIASLALFNSPILKVNYEQYRVTQASAYNLTLLPDPQISASMDNPLGNSLGAVNAWSTGIGYDLNALITHQSLVDVGDRQSKQAKLVLLWQAWQVSLQAKILSVDLYYTQKKLALTADMIATYERRYQQSKAGMIEGNVTLETNATDLSVLLDAYSQSSLLQQESNQYAHQLQQLLGIDTTSRFPLIDFDVPLEMSADEITSYLLDIDKVRPDLLALQAGYAAQEANLRAAILAQFPAFNLGISTSKDTGDLRTNGFNIGITLPLFNGNKGNILIAQTSRKQLAEEYQTRLQQAYTNVSELIQLNSILSVQQARFSENLSTMENLLSNAEKAYSQGDLAPLPFITAESTWFAKRLELFDLKRSKWRTQLSLSLLLMRSNEAAKEQATKINFIYQH